MIRRLSIRYRITTLLAVVASFAILFGYAQWRRASLVRESEALELLGVRVLWADQLHGALWPVVPEKAEFAFTEVSPDEIQIADTIYTLEQAKIQHDAIMERLKHLGVPHVVPIKNGKRQTTMVATGAEP
ncbi:hypothetical protein [Stieleria varia]|uniref:Uncharacterized protein n=1 Tax=Stieleria varia TaxID=2528005 RepID=A0A5C6AFK3_9BACT|nr:hypothetical protein [Stieleria varia]TWT98389.1 hypothetical protein Pla52n_49020 [Stieleria varia]